MPVVASSDKIQEKEEAVGVGVVVRGLFTPTEGRGLWATTTTTTPSIAYLILDPT